MSTTITETLARFDNWEKRRGDTSTSRLATPDDWQISDDEGVDLARDLAGILRQPLKVWTCRVMDRENDEDTVTVHATEEACWESLRENYDPEGLSDDEPPVAIVAYLEATNDMRIDIDVHEVSLSG